MGLIILRCIFVLVAAGLAVFFIQSDRVPEDKELAYWLVLVGMLALAVGVIALDVSIRRKDLTTITAVYFGLIVGLVLAWAAGVALTPFIGETPYRYDVQLVLGVLFCYICISLLMQTKNDFRFIIPFVEFSRELKGTKPCVLDTSAVIDGRIADVVDTNIFDGKLVMPKFVIAELQSIADSSDRLRRSRGRRGLDILNRLRNNADIELEIFDRELSEFAGQPVDMKLVILAKHLDGKLITNDYNLNKVARLQGIRVVNLNDLANALKPVFLPGEHVEVRVIKPGEEPGQGIGYLDDGTMVVVESGRDHIGEQVVISVTSVLQTSAGRMVFGRYESTPGTKNHQKPPGRKQDVSNSGGQR
jgi:uncharacterized protein YacL